jgi:hypothetical protein
MAETKGWWDYHDEIEALKDERSRVWRALLPDDPHTVDIPKAHATMIRAAVNLRHSQLMAAAREGTPSEHYGLAVDHETELTPERERWLMQMHYATFLGQRAEGHPDVLAIDAKIRELRAEQLAFCQEPDYTVEPARPGSREGDGWE